MARKLINTKKISYEEWVDLRKRSIGGSEASTIMGENKYSSLLQLYSNKLGLSKDKETNVAMQVGTHCEELVAKMFEEATGKKVRNDFFMYQHDDYDFITANLDRRIVGENAGLECKTTQAYTAKDFEDDCPTNYWWQCQQYMGVMGFDKMYLAVIISNRTFLWREIERDDDAIKRLFKQESWFWNYHIVRELPPEANENDGELLLELFPETDESEVDIDIDDDVVAYQQAQQEIKKWQARKDQAQMKIEQKLGKAEFGYGTFYRASWKNYETTRLDSKRLKADHPELYKRYSNTSQSRRFSVKERNLQ